MFRRLLTLLICVVAWTTLAQMVEQSADLRSTVNLSSATQTAAPESGRDSGSRWVAGSRAIISVTESAWASSAVHASLAAKPSGDAFVDTAVGGRGDRPASARSAHLLHIPLLI